MSIVVESFEIKLARAISRRETLIGTGIAAFIANHVGKNSKA